MLRFWQDYDWDAVWMDRSLFNYKIHSNLKLNINNSTLYFIFIAIKKTQPQFYIFLRVNFLCKLSSGQSIKIVALTQWAELIKFLTAKKAAKKGKLILLCECNKVSGLGVGREKSSNFHQGLYETKPHLHFIAMISHTQSSCICLVYCFCFWFLFFLCIPQLTISGFNQSAANSIHTFDYFILSFGNFAFCQLQYCWLDCCCFIAGPTVQLLCSALLLLLLLDVKLLEQLN